MSILQHRGPEDGRAVMENALFIRSHQMALRSMPPVDAWQSRPPVPVFYLGPEQLNNPDPLSRAVQTNWVYPVLAGTEPGLVDIRRASEAGASRFGGLSYGLLAKRMDEAAQLALQELGENNHVFHQRLLQMPELDFAALWLKGENEDYFIPLYGGHPPGTAPLQLQGDVDEVLVELREDAARRFQEFSKADADDGPTN